MKERAVEHYQSGGLLFLFRKAARYGYDRARSRLRNRLISLYQTVRARTSIRQTVVTYNGVKVRPYRTADRFVPIGITPNQGGHKNPPEYERSLVDALKGRVQRGDHVTMIGGGLGVTAVIAAREVGEDGQVVVYEGSEMMVEHLVLTLILNQVHERVEVRHATVSERANLEGSAGGAGTVSPSELPACDVLEMDCEGAESAILPKLKIRPREIIVETHNNLGRIKSQLDGLGYSIISSAIAETDPYESMCRENDIRVLVAER